MKWLPFLFYLLISAFSVPGVADDLVSPERKHAMLAASVLLQHGSTARGSGVVVRADETRVFILTAAHVVPHHLKIGEFSARIAGPTAGTAKSLPLRLVAVDRKDDVALVVTSPWDKTVRAAPVCTEYPAKFDPVFVAGTVNINLPMLLERGEFAFETIPWGEGDELTHYSGVTAPAYGGFSGGGAFASSGCVFGVMSSIWHGSAGAFGGLGLLAPLEKIHEITASLPK